MAWEWSHTAEGIDGARANLEALPVECLRTIYAEWEAWTGDSSSTSDFEEERYQVAMMEAGTMTADALAASIWSRMEVLRTCDQGGFDAWACPFGCHTVPFELEEEPA